jgi:hypothetical protein
MNSDLTEADRRMETVIDAALCELPRRPAPAGLEARVLQELSRRAAQPWWRHSFAAWPAIARVGFVLICVMLVGLAFLGGLWALESLGSPALGLLSMPWARHVLTLVDVAGELASLARIVPPSWVYEGLAASVVLYAALFGLGIAGYRTLYLDPNSQVIFRS